ncbi:MAG TPA: DUF5680 domain-containing protein [Anaerolineae bacterium]|nr:DUF5680 domain-containing protein [Anaerolineae bacterium]
MTDEQLAAFLVQAKRATYAAQGDTASITPLVPGSRQLEFPRGDWLYRDIYFGFAYFVGQETVYEKTKPIWAMSYAGGMVEENEDVLAVNEFLRTALRQVDVSSPYRGPGLLRGDGFQYTSQTNGTLENFYGIERISRSRAIVYELRYHGGRLR